MINGVCLVGLHLERDQSDAEYERERERVSMSDTADIPDEPVESMPIAVNDTYGAFMGMISEHVLDYERAAKSMVSMMLVALHNRNLLRADLEDAVSVMSNMTPADLTICAYELISELVAVR